MKYFHLCSQVATRLGSMLLLLGLTACASTESVITVREGTHSAKLISTDKRSNYPNEAVRQGRESWVVINYVIDETGRVIDPVVEDHSGHEVFVEASKRAVLRRRYLPATKNGKARVQANKIFRVDYTFLNETGASREFVVIAKDILNSSQSGETFDFKGKLALLEGKVRNLYEDAWYQWLLAQYYIDQKQSANAAKALKRALFMGSTYLDGQLYDIARQQYGFHSKEAIKKRDGFTVITHEYPDTMSSLERRSLPQLSKIIEAEISDSGSWFSKLEGTTFTVEPVSGKLGKVDYRCYTKRMLLDLPMKEPIKIERLPTPCKVFVLGEPGAALKLIIHDPNPRTI